MRMKQNHKKGKRDIEIMIDQITLFSKGNLSLSKETLPMLRYFLENISIIKTFQKTSLERSIKECINILTKDKEGLKLELRMLNSYQKADINTRIGKINTLKEDLYDLIRPMGKVLVTVKKDTYSRNTGFMY